MKPYNPEQAFTLLEILIVLLILGIILSFTMFSFTASIRRAEVTEAARSLVADITKIRNTSTKSSITTSMEWPNNAGENITAYTLNAGTPVQHSVDPKIVLTCLPEALSACDIKKLSYAPPYGEIESGLTFRVSSALNSTVKPMFVKVSGVTGKVIFSATQN